MISRRILKRYSPGNIYNADETRLFLQTMPEKFLHGKVGSNQKCALQYCCAPMQQENINLYLSLQVDLRNQCFKNVKSLPVQYKSNRKAWMTAELFNEWLNNIDTEMIKRKKKILMLLHNCSAHKLKTTLQNVELMHFSLNCTSVLQPLDK